MGFCDVYDQWRAVVSSHDGAADDTDDFLLEGVACLAISTACLPVPFETIMDVSPMIPLTTCKTKCINVREEVRVSL